MSFQGLTGSAIRALLVERVTWGWPEVHDVTTDKERAPIYGCVRLASLGRPRCGGFFLQDERVQIIKKNGKKTATHRGRPREAKRTHPMFVPHGKLT